MMNQINEIKTLIRTQKPRYQYKFNRIVNKWQTRLQQYQDNGRFAEYVEYSDKVKEHIARIRMCVGQQRGGGGLIKLQPMDFLLQPQIRGMG